MSNAPRVKVTLTLEDGLGATVISKDSLDLDGMEEALLIDIIELARRELRITEPWEFGERDE